MILDILLGDTPGIPFQNWPLFLALLVVSGALCKYTITTYLSWKGFEDGKNGEDPPTMPYILPVIGSFFTFVLDMDGFIKNASRRFGTNVPIAVKLGPFKAYVVQKPEYLSQILNAGRTLTNKPYIAPAMSQLFGTPKSMIPFYRDDNSGVGGSPIPGTNRPAHQRVWAHHHHSAAVYLNGKSLRYLGERFISVLSEALDAVQQGDPPESGDWVELPDFYLWWRKRLFRASVEAMFGPHLLRIYPGLEEDFWTYHAGIPKMLKFYPRFLCPGPYDARDRILEGLERWHAFAREHSDPHRPASTGDGDGDGERPDDEFWGSAWIRYRYRWGKDTGVLDGRALAAEDLTMLTAANANAVPMAFWYLAHVYSDASLRERVLRELGEAMSTAPAGRLPRLDLGKMLQAPLLQSVSAEVLRLYASFLLTRMADGPDPQDMRLGPWRIDRRGVLALSTASAARNTEAWGEERTEVALGRFWAERFLRRGDGRFSLERLAGAWIPFAAGTLMCPGRHLAKQELIGSAAVFAACFDLEMLGPVPPMDSYHYYGMGTQPPAAPCRVRIRRKIRVDAQMKATA